MDRAEAIKRCDRYNEEWANARAKDVEPFIAYNQSLDDLFYMAGKALREQEQREQNEPLTLEDLRKMNGEPVWIADGGFWALVRVEHNVKLIANDHETANAEGWLKHIGAIYRYKPEGADHA